MIDDTAYHLKLGKHQAGRAELVEWLSQLNRLAEFVEAGVERPRFHIPFEKHASGINF